MLMQFGPLNDGIRSKHRLEATVVGSGVAWIATNGRTIKGTWKKTALTKPTRFFDATGRGHADGRPDLRPGDARSATVTIKAGSKDARRRRRPVGVARPAAVGPGRLRAPAGADLGVDRARLAGDVGPGPAFGRRRARAAIAASPLLDAVVGPDRREGHGQPLRVARLDEDPGRTDHLRQRPDGRGDDRRPAGDRLDRGQAGRVRDARAGSPPGRRGRGRPVGLGERGA